MSYDLILCYPELCQAYKLGKATYHNDLPRVPNLYEHPAIQEAYDWGFWDAKEEVPAFTLQQCLHSASITHVKN